MQEIQEGKAVINNETAQIISKDLPVFYNPLMRHNRDISILLLSLENRKLQCCDLLAGSGIRSIRLLKEIPETIQHITINDYDPTTVERAAQNLKLNKIAFEEWDLHKFIDESKKQEGPGSKEKSELPQTILTNTDGSQLLLASNGYDYIDIDPFGSPNSFLDAACKRLSRKGILALTFTDTSALAGSYPEACKRKYWGVPTKGARIHEVGLRILIRKVQLVAAQYEKALTPIIVYNQDHYYRAYFRCEKGKRKCDALFEQHGVWSDEKEAGPLWTGTLCDLETLEKMSVQLKKFGEQFQKDYAAFLKTLLSENSFEQPGHYYQLNELQKETGPIRKEELLDLLGDEASIVHYEGNAIKTAKSVEEIRSLIKNTKPTNKTRKEQE